MQESIYTQEEERLNYATHAAATVLSTLGLVYLIDKALAKQDLYLLIAVAVYGVSLVISFLSSTVYHYVEQPNYKYNCRLLDHYAIYLVIVGSYTPFAVIAMPREIGIPVLVTIWTLSLLAMYFKYRIWSQNQMQQKATIDTIVYICIGSTALIFLPSFVQYLTWECVYWVITGGVVYIIGAMFYLWKSFPYNHVIWHLLVIIAAAIHYYTIVEYVVA